MRPPSSAAPAPEAQPSDLRRREIGEECRRLEAELQEPDLWERGPSAGSDRRPEGAAPPSAWGHAPGAGGGPKPPKAVSWEGGTGEGGLAGQALGGATRDVSEALAEAQRRSEEQRRPPWGKGAKALGDHAPRGGSKGQAPSYTEGWGWAPGEDPWQGLHFPCSVRGRTERPGTRCCRGCGAAVCPDCTSGTP